MRKVADSFNVHCYDTLTGFKHIAAKIKSLEGREEYIGGGEESFGYLIGDFVRDKDSVSGCRILAEMTAYAADKGQTLYDMLMELYVKYAFYTEKQVSVTRKGKSGAQEIEAMMNEFRSNPPKALDGIAVERTADYLYPEKTGLPKSNVLQYFLADGSKVSVRPSGTEPKIKFYFSICSKLEDVSQYASKHAEAMQKIEVMQKEMGLK